MSAYIPSFSTLATGFAGFSTLSLGLLYYGQNFLIYPSAFPPSSRTDVPNPGAYNLPYENVTLVTEDHVKVHAYLIMQQTEETGAGMTNEKYAATRPTVIMFHGNGGNVGHRVPLAMMFYKHNQCNVLMLSYRGYGHSQGSPSEKGIRMDSQAALNYVTSHPILGNTQIVLYGQSIGGAVAIDLASRNPSKIRALILENTFLSIPRLIPTVMPWLARVSFLCHQRWDSASKISLLPPTMPVLMLSGKQDEIVPKEHMQGLELLLRPKNEEDARRPGSFISFLHGSHNDTCLQPQYWDAIAAFIRTLA